MYIHFALIYANNYMCMHDNNNENYQSDGGEACAPQIIIIIYLYYNLSLSLYIYIIWKQRKCVCMADYTRTKQTLT